MCIPPIPSFPITYEDQTPLIMYTTVRDYIKKKKTIETVFPRNYFLEKTTDQVDPINDIHIVSNSFYFLFLSFNS
jgi:hypothetical protein